MSAVKGGRRYAVRRRDGSILASPWRLDDPGMRPSEVWFWTGRVDDAHHFESRGSAKAILRGLMPPVVMADISFVPVA